MSSVEVEITPFKPQTASSESWAAFHAYRRQRHEEQEPDDPLMEDRNVETYMKRPRPNTRILRFAVHPAETPQSIIGWIYFEVFREESPSYENNKHMAWINIELLAPYRKRGIGKQMLAEVAELTRSHGRSLVVGGTDEEDGKGFIKAIGAQVAISGRESRLRLEEVDWEMVGRWISEGTERSPATSLHFTKDRMDDNVLEAYCEVLTEVSNQEPRGDLDVGDQIITPDTYRDREARITSAGGSLLAAFTQESNGDLSGLTEMGYYADEGPLIRQWMTGVKDVYRGRGLGKWLKAAMLERVRQELPQVEVVVTGNATINAPMLSINERLGFKPHKEGFDAQMTLEALQGYLKGAASWRC